MPKHSQWIAAIALVLANRSTAHAEQSFMYLSNVVGLKTSIQLKHKPIKFRAHPEEVARDKGLPTLSVAYREIVYITPGRVSRKEPKDKNEPFCALKVPSRGKDHTLPGNFQLDVPLQNYQQDELSLLYGSTPGGTQFECTKYDGKPWTSAELAAVIKPGKVTITPNNLKRYRAELSSDTHRVKHVPADQSGGRGTGQTKDSNQKHVK